MEGQAFQDCMTGNHCFGCGTLNPDGLQIKSRWDGDTAICIYEPKPHQNAGPTNYFNGGIIATVIDCHCVCTAYADYFRREDKPIGSEPELWYVTGSIHVDYLRPTPIDQPVLLRAQVIDAGPRKTRVACSLLSGDRECARGEVVAVKVDPKWKARTRDHSGPPSS